MRAEVTYHGGRSYRMLGVRFTEGRTVEVTNPAVVARARTTAGFAVRVLAEDKPKKKIRKVITPPATARAEAVAEEKPRKRSRPADD